MLQSKTHKHIHIHKTQQNRCRKKRPKTDSRFPFERHYLLTLNKQKWRRRSSQIQFPRARKVTKGHEFCKKERRKPETLQSARERQGKTAKKQPQGIDEKGDEKAWESGRHSSIIHLPAIITASVQGHFGGNDDRVTQYLLKGTSLSSHDLWPCSLFFPFILGHLSIFVLFLFLGLLFLGMISLVVVIVKGLGFRVGFPL